MEFNMLLNERHRHKMVRPTIYNNFKNIYENQ